MIRRGRWLPNPPISWLRAGETQADAIHDLETSDNQLSLFRVESREEAKRVCTALAANRGNLSNLDFALVREEVVRHAGIEVEKRVGQTPDDVVNSWHYNFVELTTHKLCLLSRMIAMGKPYERIMKKDITAYIEEGCRTGMLNIGGVSKRIVERLRIDSRIS